MKRLRLEVLGARRALNDTACRPPPLQCAQESQSIARVYGWNRGRVGVAYPLLPRREIPAFRTSKSFIMCYRLACTVPRCFRWQSCEAMKVCNRLSVLDRDAVYLILGSNRGKHSGKTW